MNVRALVELGCCCATVDAAISSRHIPKNEKALIVFISFAPQRSTFPVGPPRGAAIKLMPQTTEAEAHGDEKVPGSRSGNATSVLAQVKNELNRKTNELGSAFLSCS